MPAAPARPRRGRKAAAAAPAEEWPDLPPQLPSRKLTDASDASLQAAQTQEQPADPRDRPVADKVTKEHEPRSKRNARGSPADATQAPEPPSEEPERRIAPDGNAYTKAEFKKFYRGFKEWDKAKPALPEKPDAVQQPSAPTDPAAKREAAARAAEERAASQAARGMTREKAEELQRKQTKDEILGKIQAHYALRKKEFPMGLNLASVDQLREHYNEIRGKGAEAVLGSNLVQEDATRKRVDPIVNGSVKPQATSSGLATSVSGACAMTSDHGEPRLSRDLIRKSDSIRKSS